MKIPAVTHALLAVFLRISYMSKRPLMIRGEPGVGKSAAPADFARSMGWDGDYNLSAEQAFGLIDLRALYRDPVDFKGMPAIDQVNEVFKWVQDGKLPMQQFVDSGMLPERGLLFLDELPAAPPAVQAALYELSLDRCINGMPLAEGWSVVAAGNSLKDKAVVNRMPSPSVSRFWHVKLEVSTEAWRKWAFNNGILEDLIAFFRFREDLLMSFDPAKWEQDTPYCCPRAVEILHDLMVSWDEINPGEKVPIQLVNGAVGEGVGTELWAFLDIRHALPTVEEILKDPKGTKMPKEPSQIYAIMTSLVRASDEKTLKPIFEYMQKAPPEYEIAYAQDVMLTQDDSLGLEPAFVDHTIRHKSIYQV